MKKIIALVLSLGILFASSVTYAESEITGAGNEAGYVNISGKSDLVFENISYTVVPAGAEENVLNAVSAGESISGENGDFEISVKADFPKSLWKDGDYTVSLRVGDDEVIKYNFYYYSENKKEEIKSDFIGMPDGDALKGESDVYKTFCAMGAELYRLSDSDMDDLASAVLPGVKSEMDDEELVKVLNKGVLAVISNKGEEADGGLLEVYEDFRKLEEEQQSWILKALPENGEYDDINELDEGYELVKVLCRINFAKHSEISDLLKNNKDIFDSSIYTDFFDMTSVKIGKACEKIADKLKNHDAYTAEDIDDIVEDAVKAVDKKSSSSGGGGGGGSSQGFVSSNPSGTKVEQSELPSVPENDVFRDLGSVSWAKEAVEALYKKGIITGVTENTFEPDRPVTREEFAAMIVRAAGISDMGGEMNFDDVKSGDWYYEAVKTAYSNGVTTGISGTVFGAGKYITRQDMAVMTVRVFDIQPGNGAADFTDSHEISDYAAESISKLCSAGIISGMGDGTFLPGGNTTRAQAAVVLYRIIGK